MQNVSLQNSNSHLSFTGVKPKRVITTVASEVTKFGSGAVSEYLLCKSVGLGEIPSIAGSLFTGLISKFSCDSIKSVAVLTEANKKTKTVKGYLTRLSRLAKTKMSPLNPIRRFFIINKT